MIVRITITILIVRVIEPIIVRIGRAHIDVALSARIMIVKFNVTIDEREIVTLRAHNAEDGRIGQDKSATG